MRACVRACVRVCLCLSRLLCVPLCACTHRYARATKAACRAGDLVEFVPSDLAEPPSAVADESPPPLPAMPWIEVRACERAQAWLACLSQRACMFTPVAQAVVRAYL